MHSIEAVYKEHSKMVYRYLLSLTKDLAVCQHFFVSSSQR